MKVTLEPHSGGIYTAATDAEHISEIVKLFKGLLVAAGYHPSTVDEYFTEEQWFETEIVATNVKVIEDRAVK